MHALATYLSTEKLLKRVPKIDVSYASVLVVKDGDMKKWTLTHDEYADYGLTRGGPVKFPEDALRREYFVVNTEKEFRCFREEMVELTNCTKNDLAKLYSLAELEVMREVHEFENLIEEVEAEAAAFAGNLEDQ